MRKQQKDTKNRFFKRKACETDLFSLYSENKFKAYPTVRVYCTGVPEGLRREY
jgi:hypothetical protein